MAAGCGVLLLLVAGAARASAPVSVRTHVVVHSSALTLADLLPASASPQLRSEASRISLGAAPQPPMTRILYRQQLEFLLANDRPLAKRLRLPSEISVERFHRAITSEEIASAIRRAVGTGAVALDLDHLQLQSPVYVTEADPGLTVIRIASDPMRHETRFRLWTSKEPANLPFTVTVAAVLKLPTLVSKRAVAPGEIVSATDFAVEMRPAAQSVPNPPAAAQELAGLQTRAALNQGQPVTRFDFAKAVLVQPGVLATLVVRGSGFSIKTQVTPLEAGVLGQEVRVRNTESRRVLEAKVIGRDELLEVR
ncbi:MAG: flagellar basal body P-ring formation chaperone FlgA [Terriglobia bacterium]